MQSLQDALPLKVHPRPWKAETERADPARFRLPGYCMVSTLLLPGVNRLIPAFR